MDEFVNCTDNFINKFLSGCNLRMLEPIVFTSSIPLWLFYSRNSDFSET